MRRQGVRSGKPASMDARDSPTSDTFGVNAGNPNLMATERRGTYPGQWESYLGSGSATLT